MGQSKHFVRFREGVYFFKPSHEFPRSIYKGLYEDYPVSNFSNEIQFGDDFYKENPTLELNEINSFGFRCDEFTKQHSGKHVLFAGCSYTFGSGMLYDEVWANAVYKKISSVKKCSGYFNLGIRGSSLIHQTITLFKYFRTYGNPDIIFFNIPDLSRFYSYDEENKNIIDAYYLDKKSFPLKYLIYYHYYLMLDQYCLTNNIKLFSFSWTYAQNKNTTEFKDSSIDKFNTFYPDDIKTINKKIIRYLDENKNKKFLQLARDKQHLGIAYHEYWANFIYSKAEDVILKY